MQPPRPFLDGHYALLLSLWLLQTNYQLLRKGQGNILRKFIYAEIIKSRFFFLQFQMNHLLSGSEYVQINKPRLQI